MGPAEHHADLGPVRLEVILSALTAISEEMGAALRRTARSTTVREMADFSTGVFDALGRNVELRIDGLQRLRDARWREWRVDATHSNVWNDRDHAELEQTGDGRVTGGMLTWKGNLPANSVVLVELK